MVAPAEQRPSRRSLRAAHLSPRWWVGAIIAFGLALALPAVARLEGTANPSGEAFAQVLPQGVVSSDFVEVRGLSGLAVSPDGRFAAIRLDQQQLSDNSTHLNWYVIDLSTGRATHLAVGGAPLWNVNGDLANEKPQWSADSAWLYYRAAMNGEVQVWRSDRHGLRSEAITHDAADVLAFTADVDGTLTYAAQGASRKEVRLAEDGEYDTGVLLDQSVITGFALTRNFPVNGRMATYRTYATPAGRKRSSLLSERPLKFQSLNVKTGRLQPVDAAVRGRFERNWTVGAGVRFWDAGDARFRTEGAVSDLQTAAAVGGDTLARVVSSASLSAGVTPDTRSGRVLVWQRSDGSATPCIDAVCLGADGLAVIGWRTGQRGLVFQTTRFGEESLHVWDVVDNTVRSIADGESVLGSDSSGLRGACKLALNDSVICIESSASEPARLVSIDLISGARRSLFAPNAALEAKLPGAPEKLALQDQWGSTTFARLVLPPGIHEPTAPPMPLVITTYGCQGFLLGGTGEDMSEYLLASAGYAAICIDLSVGNVRRANGFTGEGRQSNDSMLGFFHDAVRQLAARGIADPRRVAIAGFSGSTTGVTYALTQTNAFITAVVTTDGSSDVISCYLNAPTGQCPRLARRETPTKPFDSRDGILASSPAWNASKIRTPLLMQLAEVEYRGMLQLYGAMSDDGKAVEMYVFPDAYHFKHQPRQRKAVYDRNLAWVRFWLKGEEVESRDLAAQYERWRGLRIKQCALFTDAEGAESPWYCRPV